jgi:CubicO group peptidase (beta-lactamase class C family)
VIAAHNNNNKGGSMTTARTLVNRAWVHAAAGVLLVTTLAGCQMRTEAPRPGEALAGMSAERLQRLDTHFHKLVDEGRIAGVVTWIQRRGQVVHEDAYGLADIEARRPMSKDSYFYVYSMTKPITSVALLMLHEEGRVVKTRAAIASRVLLQRKSRGMLP